MSTRYNPGPGYRPSFKVVCTDMEAGASVRRLCGRFRHTTKCGAGRICGADLNGDNLWISRAYLRISNHCRVRVRVWVRVRVRVRVRNLELRLGL